MRRRWISVSLACVCVLLAGGLRTRAVEGSHPREVLALSDILEPLGKNTEEFVRSFQETACLEKVEQRLLGKKGRPRRTRTIVYEYLFTMQATRQGIAVQEMRREKQQRRGGDGDSPLMITNGFPATVLIFHPRYRENFDYGLAGAEKVGGRDTLLVTFRQKTDRRNELFSFRHGNSSWPVYVRGRAWVDSDNFQVVALETEMIEPNPKVGLSAETTRIEYEEVSFSHPKQQLWLPKRVYVELSWKGRRFQNEHTFTHYMAFDVDTRQTIQLPQAADK